MARYAYFIFLTALHNFTFEPCLILIAGGDLNQPNAHGTTPLMDLIMSSEGDLAMDVLCNIWKKKPDVSFCYAV
jgi:hypothetical protein